MDSTEAELENFRQKWREEVTGKTKEKTNNHEATPKPSQASSSRTPASKQSIVPKVSQHARHRSVEEIDEVEPHVYPDLGEVQHGRRLDETSPPAPSSSKEPHSALEHYEKAVEKESQGSLGESVNLYRKAFRLDSNVHQTYKNKHFPPSSLIAKPKPQDVNPSNASPAVPNTAHHSLNGLPSNLQSLLESFSTFSIQGEPPPTDLSPAPPCPISAIPDEILSDILLEVALTDIASFARLAQVCKRLAYLVTTEERIWKRIATGDEVGFGDMPYSFASEIDGRTLDEAEDPGRLTTYLVPSIYPTYRALFRERPRVRFNGCYISTVNYTRPGASSPTSVSWNSPIHIVTYYRYLRFLRDGTCISLLTTSEPADVVPYLHMEHVHKNHGNLPSAPMKDALLGNWWLSGPAFFGVDGQVRGQKEGFLHVETEGATPKYMYKMILAFGSAGRGARNNKLMWQDYWSYNKLTDDWAEFFRKNERPFYWSRVKSYV